MEESPTLAGLLSRSAPDRPPSESLPAIVELRTHLEELEALHVLAAADAGWTWTQIAESLGVSKQAAHSKHAERVRERSVPQPPPTNPPRVLITGEARQAVRHAREEARVLGRPTVGTEHLLLGVMHGSGPAAKALEALGMAPDEVRAALGPPDARGRGAAGRRGRRRSGGGRLEAACRPRRARDLTARAEGARAVLA